MYAVNLGMISNPISDTVQPIRQFVVQQVFESRVAKFLNQKPEKSFFVRRVVVSAAYLAAVSGSLYLTPYYGLAATIVMIPVIKLVAKRVATIGGNCLYHATIVAQKKFRGLEIDRPLSERITGLMEEEGNPLIVSCFGAIVGEIVWNSFITFPTPIVIRGVAKDAMKGLVSAPFKQVGMAAAQYGFNSIFGVDTINPLDSISVEGAFIDTSCNSGGTAAIDLACAHFACSLFAKLVLYSVGFEIGRDLGKRVWTFADSKIKNKLNIHSIFI